MKKITTIIGACFFTLFLVAYFTYLNLPYEKILNQSLPKNVELKANIEPTLFGGLSLTNVHLKYPASPMPLLSEIQEFEIGFSLLSLLLGNFKVNLSLINWSDKNLGFQKTTVQDVSVKTSISGLMRIIQQDFSTPDPFHITVVSDTQSSDLLLDLDWNFNIHPRTKQLSQFKAKVKFKLSRNLASLEPLLTQTGINMGAKKNGFFHFEVSQDPRGRLTSTPL